MRFTIRHRKDRVLRLPPKERNIITMTHDDTINTIKEHIKPLLDEMFPHLPQLADIEDWLSANPKAMLNVFAMHNSLSGLKQDRAIYHARWLSEDGPLLIWAVHRSMQDAMRKAFPTAAYIISGMTERAADTQIQRFMDGKTDILILSLRAASEGINLTRATQSLMTECDWTPARHLQAEDRANRIGSIKPLMVHYLVLQNSLDGILQKRLQDKQHLVSTIIDGNPETMFHNQVQGNREFIRMLAQQILLAIQ